MVILRIRSDTIYDGAYCPNYWIRQILLSNTVIARILKRFLLMTFPSVDIITLRPLFWNVCNVLLPVLAAYAQAGEAYVSIDRRRDSYMLPNSCHWWRICLTKHEYASVRAFLYVEGRKWVSCEWGLNRRLTHSIMFGTVCVQYNFMWLNIATVIF
jgi:hypothetical protein